jgi:membrane associated rhomboid family serine protease
MTASPVEGYTRRQTALDLAGVAAVPGLLIAVHVATSAPDRYRLAFAHGEFAVHTLVTAAYVHADLAHLFGNVVGYLLPTLYAYVLCLRVGRRRWFLLTTLSLLVVLPVAVNVADYLVLTALYPTIEVVTRGFSGVAAGFGGFLLVALVVSIRDRVRDLGWRVGQVAVLVVLLELDVIYVGGVRPATVALVALGVALSLGEYWYRYDVALPATAGDRRAVLVEAGEVVVVLLALVLQVAAMFPAQLVQDGTLVGVFAHAAGFLFGVAVALGTLAVDRG